ncbi:hypothetical protein EDD29_7703 [Actinocorallia herbida]|uniref:Uncharacterized protein n=1 Tax=Actinocorallia herbida TaxID=58109 RepID=A0A3N1D8Y4_9ACTN|nr:hypothetical protein [Actinocorallia herbida]ROO89990.1 hypothetical protein EDD29_7703 [Actinocorallia herbida]
MARRPRWARTGPAQAPDAAAEDEERRWTERLTLLSTVGPPTTLAAGLLIWYGYVATLQRFRYFGVELQLTGLANQDLLLFGLEIAYPAAVLLLVVVLACLTLHTGLGLLLRTRPRAVRWIAPAVALTGAALLVRALVGVLVRGVAEHERPGTTPLSLTVCAPLLVYGFWLARRAWEGGWRESAEAEALERRGRTLAIALAVVGLFWAANSLAAEVGVARAYDSVKRLDRLPEVVLYTKEPLADAPAETRQWDFGKKATFRYRYQNLRLLLASGGRLFLVPLTWKPTDTTARLSTFVVPYDTNIRLQLIPRPTP